jgi:predicted Rdx family selenoprotein
MVSDFVHDAIPKTLADEIKRVLLESENQGIFLSKKQAGIIVAEKSKRGKMDVAEIKDYIRKLRNLNREDKKIK